MIDKESILPEIEAATDCQYWVKESTEEQHLAVCNNFWWCTNNIAKGLWRAVGASYREGEIKSPDRIWCEDIHIRGGGMNMILMDIFVLNMEHYMRTGIVLCYAILEKLEFVVLENKEKKPGLLEVNL